MKTETKEKIKSVDSMLDELLDLRATIERTDDRGGSYICLTALKDSEQVSAFVMGDTHTLSAMIASFLVTQPEIFDEVLNQLTKSAMMGLLKKED